jgi:2-polyprenyl-3-methyl-5-hydroxy-6-metoxy-1,4-benzoquinol methylase
MLVLDIACGPGYVSATAKQLGAIPTGIDLSENMARDYEANVSRDSIQAR